MSKPQADFERKFAVPKVTQERRSALYEEAVDDLTVATEQLEGLARALGYFESDVAELAIPPELADEAP